MTDSGYQRCRKCGSTKPIDLFPRNRAVPGGYDRMCKSCWKARPRAAVSEPRPKAVYETVDPTAAPAFQGKVESLKKYSDLPRGRFYDLFENDGIEVAVDKFKARFDRVPETVYVNGHRIFIPVTDDEAATRKQVVIS